MWVILVPLKDNVHTVLGFVCQVYYYSIQIVGNDEIS